MNTLYLHIYLIHHEIVRRSRLELFCKKGVLRNFPKFTGKHLCQGLWHMCLPVNFSNFLKAPSFIEHPWWLLLDRAFHTSSVYLTALEVVNDLLFTGETCKTFFKKTRVTRLQTHPSKCQKTTGKMKEVL